MVNEGYYDHFRSMFNFFFFFIKIIFTFLSIFAVRLSCHVDIKDCKNIRKSKGMFTSHQT